MQTYKKMSQQNLFETTESYRHTNKFISEYRISLVRDRQVAFNDTVLMNSVQAHGLFTKIIETHGQTDREQFVVVLLNAKNHVIGYNYFYGGDSTTYHTGWKEYTIDLSSHIGNCIEIQFKTYDQGDSIYDTAALLDSIRLE